MMRNVYIVATIIHLLLLSISTYVAAVVDIETILVSGVICSISGLIAGVVSLHENRFLLGAICLLTPLLALALLLLEAFVLHLGPSKAKVPFCIVFVLNQTVTTLVGIGQLVLAIVPQVALKKQFSLSGLMSMTCSLAAF